jgi:hypothetical protein
MPLMKNIYDFFMRYVLLRRSKERNVQAVDRPDHTNETRLVTLRTYEPGGDPFNDRIEFHLSNAPGVPSGFREPNKTADLEADA